MKTTEYRIHHANGYLTPRSPESFEPVEVSIPGALVLRSSMMQHETDIIGLRERGIDVPTDRTRFSLYFILPNVFPNPDATVPTVNAHASI